ncbi:hypothetical protein JXA31_09940 [Candidatus Bathyarchaeota archaeon]|nr:hypothetical protein [Candidatus Bathyarchaeota archaeon]
MPSEYKFLRFEIVGLFSVIFFLIGILPLIRIELIANTFSALSTSLSILASLLLLSLPLGYWEHQFIVNKYRSEKRNRPAMLFLQEMILTKIPENGKKGRAFYNTLSTRKKSALLASLLDLCVYSNTSGISDSIYERLADRWSHFYARKAVGVLAPIIGIILFIIGLLAGTAIWSNAFSFGWQRIVISGAIWAVIFAISLYLINRYSIKIWEEVCFLESEIVLSKEEENRLAVENVIERVAEHPEFFSP